MGYFDVLYFKLIYHVNVLNIKDIIICMMEMKYYRVKIVVKTNNHNSRRHPKVEKLQSRMSEDITVTIKNGKK